MGAGDHAALELDGEFRRVEGGVDFFALKAWGDRAARSDEGDAGGHIPRLPVRLGGDEELVIADGITLLGIEVPGGEPEERDECQMDPPNIHCWISSRIMVNT